MCLKSSLFALILLYISEVMCTYPDITLEVMESQTESFDEIQFLSTLYELYKETSLQFYSSTTSPNIITSSEFIMETESIEIIPFTEIYQYPSTNMIRTSVDISYNSFTGYIISSIISSSSMFIPTTSTTTTITYVPSSISPSKTTTTTSIPSITITHVYTTTTHVHSSISTTVTSTTNTVTSTTVPVTTSSMSGNLSNVTSYIPSISTTCNPVHINEASSSNVITVISILVGLLLVLVTTQLVTGIVITLLSIYIIRLKKRTTRQDRSSNDDIMMGPCESYDINEYKARDEQQYEECNPSNTTYEIIQ